MRGRTKEPPTPEVVRVEKVGGKNRPTPRRSSSVAANRRPLVAKDRRGATAVSRSLTRTERQRAQAGRLAGEERYLGARDAGPVRAYVRDLVDSRRNIGDYFMPIIIVAVLAEYLVSSTTRDAALLDALITLLWLVVAVLVVDSLVLRRHVRRRVAERFGPGARSGVTGYAVLRAAQMRRLRIPRPAVTRGQAPRGQAPR